MENKRFNRIIGASIILFILIAAFIFIKPSVSAYSSLTVKKCKADNTDDCWHSLAHKTLNAAFCSNIQDNETKEHCLKHVQEDGGK